MITNQFKSINQKEDKVKNYLIKLRDDEITNLELNELYKQIQNLLYDICHKNLFLLESNGHTIEDGVQFIWEKLLKSKHTFDETRLDSTKPKASLLWLYNVSWNRLSTIKYVYNRKIKTTTIFETNKQKYDYYNTTDLVLCNKKRNQGKLRVQMIIDSLENEDQSFVEMICYPTQELLNKYSKNKKKKVKKLSIKELKKEMNLNSSKFNKLLKRLKPIVMELLDEELHVA